MPDSWVEAPRVCDLHSGHTVCALSSPPHTPARARRDRYSRYRSPLYHAEGQTAASNQSYRKVIPVKFMGGVPTEMVPNHDTARSLVNGSLPVARPESGLLPERGCGMPVFLSYVANPS